MRRFCLVLAAAIATCASSGLAQVPAAGPYKVLKTAKVGGTGSFDYVYADVDGRRLYIPRGGTGAVAATAIAAAVPAVLGRINVFNLDTLEPVGVIPNASARGAAVDPKSGHGFASSKPVVMWDTKTLATIKTIDVQGSPDGIMFDPFNQRVHVFSHSAPNDTVINAVDGTVLGTIDLGGQPEQAQSDRNGHIYVDLEDKSQIAVVDASTMKVTAHYDISTKGGSPAGLGLDIKNHILFATCADGGTQAAQGAPATMVMLDANDGKIITSLPIGGGTDGGGFNANTMEAFSSNGTGTLSIIKENSPTSFVVEQNLATTRGAKTMTIDTKTNHVLLISAEYGPAPAPPAGGGRGGRAPMLPDSFTIWVTGK